MLAGVLGAGLPLATLLPFLSLTSHPSDALLSSQSCHPVIWLPADTLSQRLVAAFTEKDKIKKGGSVVFCNHSVGMSP